MENKSPPEEQKDVTKPTITVSEAVACLRHQQVEKRLPWSQVRTGGSCQFGHQYWAASHCTVT